MTKQKVIAWGLVLLIVSIAWAFLMDTESGGTETASFWLRLGTAFGLGGPIFFNTGAVAGIYYYWKRKITAAMWTWTGLVVGIYVFLMVGGVEWGQRGYAG
jgi:hypothetical protein